MTSNFIFSCCNGRQPIDSEESNNSVSRNIIIKNKTFTSLNSPKASLKSLSFQRNNNNNQNSQINNIHLASTVDIAHINQSKNIPSRPIHNFVRIQRSVQPRTIAQKRSPSINGFPLVQQRIVHFSYKNPQVQHIQKQKFIHFVNQPKNINNIQVPKFMPYIPEVKKQLQPKQIAKQNNKINQQKQKEQLQQKQKNIAQIQKTINHIPTINPNKYILGGSKFTILSQQQVEQILNQSQLPLQQSAIIMNVFNPTKSQMKNWSLKPSMASIPENNKHIKIKQSQYKN